jgi:Fe-S-cluster containining protein
MTTKHLWAFGIMRTLMGANLREIPLIVEQIVPSPVCAVCDVCCRFPDAESALRPYFTSEEIQRAIAAGVSPDAFSDHRGAKITLIPHGEGYMCPAFEPTTGRCGIYEDRPLDCRLYPVAIMWDASRTQVVMGWDAQCPFIAERLETPESQAYVERTHRLLESDGVTDTIHTNPQLVGAFQETVITLKPLEGLTRRLTNDGPNSASSDSCRPQRV